MGKPGNRRIHQDLSVSDRYDSRTPTGVFPFGGAVRWNRLRTSESETGATIVEFALVLPLLILISFAIMEFGVAFYEYLSVERATNDGVRTVAFMGSREDADCVAVTTVAAAVPGSMLARIDRVEIFKADGNGNPLPGQVNVWRPGTGPCGGLVMQSEGYPAPSRQTEAPLSSSDPSLALVGVRLVLDRSWITGFGPFSGDYSIDESSLLRIEPEIYAE